MEPDRFLIRAGVLLPISTEPIHDGAVLVSGQRIEEVGPWDQLARVHSGTRVVDRTDCLVLPGLINAHCHLDYTRMAAGIPPRKSFSDWIKAILAYKADWSYTDFAESWVAGAKMLLDSGTTTVLDIEAVPELLTEVLGSTPLRVVSAIEMTGIHSGKDPQQILSETLAAIAVARVDDNSVALSPHSLYSTKPALVRLAAAAAADRNWLITMHVAESTEESDMFRKEAGPLYDWLKTQRDMTDCDGRSPVKVLDDLGVLSDRFIAVHGNSLSGGDIELLAARGCSVVHCPRSHDYFRHPTFPLQRLQEMGVNVCLGTDSLASVRGTNRSKIELSLFKEMRQLAKVHPGLSAESIVRMATVNGAGALGRASQLGELRPGAVADLVAIPAALQSDDPYGCVVENRHPVTSVWIDGRRVHST